MYLGIDYGSKRIGIALGEAFPKPFSILDAKQDRDDLLTTITKICNDNNVDTIVIGLPKHVNGSEGSLVPEVKEFAKALSDFSSRPVEFEDEDYSSIEVENMINNLGISERKRRAKREKIDAIAATIILSRYIERKGEQHY